MKFNEYGLYYAINNIYSAFEEKHFKPRSADWYIFVDKRKELCEAIKSEMRLEIKNVWIEDDLREDFSDEKILKAWDDFGKNKEKYKFLIKVAKNSSRHCYYGGSCSQIMSYEQTLNKNLPERPEWCVIVCNKHGRK